MKIILIHNFYGSNVPSGENLVYEAEKKMLEERGHEVHTFIRHSDEIRSEGLWGLIKGASSTPWNIFTYREIKEFVKKVKPDIVHVHNTFPMISPSIFHAIGSATALVFTLHNYRIFCASGIPMRNNDICTECLDKKSALPSLKYGCYRNSRIATFPIAVSINIHGLLSTWNNKVSAYIALTEFQKNKVISAGLKAEKVYVKPNFYPGSPKVVNWDMRENTIIFAGRLSDEKGVRNLVLAWRIWGKNAPQLNIIGDGPLRFELENMAKELNIKFFGQLSTKDAQMHISNSKLLLLPSECFEGFPLVIREAFAFGTPVAVSSIGPLINIVKLGKCGVHFEPRNPKSLFKIVKDLWCDQSKLKKLSEGARYEFNEFYNEQVNYNILLNIYNKAIASLN